MHTRSRPAGPIAVSAIATVTAGIGMAMQGTANGTLGEILGSGVFAATVSFLVGLLLLAVMTLVVPAGRCGFVRAVRAFSSRELPWWMFLGGLGGAAIVMSQAFTVPLMGVAVFTMAFVAGQLVGALIVDNTDLPPGGRKHLTAPRMVGSLIVLVGVSLSAVGVIAQGVPPWAPVLPLVAGVATAFQQATNGRLKQHTRSALAATTTNFVVGGIALVIASAVVLAAGTRVVAVPTLPAELWVLCGGLLGVAFIGVTTVTVAHLGVLLLSLMSLFGNLVGSLAIDLTFHSAEAEVNATTYISMAIVIVGVVVTTMRPTQARGR
ncbi:DMT family transporter [Microbacterium gubbeenense]|uniref:DMT family transporter n=1 Tax=Microbacterium gubbeenense TaxID=159896 RepID=UPI003F9B9E25